MYDACRNNIYIMCISHAGCTISIHPISVQWRQLIVLWAGNERQCVCGHPPPAPACQHSPFSYLKRQTLSTKTVRIWWANTQFHRDHCCKHVSSSQSFFPGGVKFFMFGSQNNCKTLLKLRPYRTYTQHQRDTKNGPQAQLSKNQGTLQTKFLKYLLHQHFRWNRC